MVKAVSTAWRGRSPASLAALLPDRFASKSQSAQSIALRAAPAGRNGPRSGRFAPGAIGAAEGLTGRTRFSEGLPKTREGQAFPTPGVPPVAHRATPPPRLVLRAPRNGKTASDRPSLHLDGETKPPAG